LLLATRSAFAQVTGPNVVSGDTYTVTYTRMGTTTYLQEKVGTGGTWVNVTSVNGGSGGVPYTFYGKTAAEYFYRTNVKTVGYRGSITWWTSAEKRIVVTGPLPANRDTIANQVQYPYAARISDINYDGQLDVFVSRTSGGSAGNGSIQDVILRNLGNGTFAAEVPTAAQVAVASTWPQSEVRLERTDLNLDGFVDLSIPELGQYIPGALGQIVVAPGGTGPAVQRVIPMDTKYMNFTKQTKSWLQNPNYFVDNSPMIMFPIWGYVYKCDYVWRNDYYEWTCGYFWEIVGYEAQLDTSWADQDALRLRYNFQNVVNGVLQLTVEPGSAQTQSIDAIFSSVFGIQVFRGGLLSWCVDWDYDPDSRPLCVDFGAIALKAIQSNPTDPAPPCRKLTTGEKDHAIKNGLRIPFVEQSRICNTSGFGTPETELHSKNGDIYIGKQNIVGKLTPRHVDWSEDYSQDVGGVEQFFLEVIVHELTHVYQVRTGCLAECLVQFGGTARADYVYWPWDGIKPYDQHKLEARAQMVSDRFRFIVPRLPRTSDRLNDGVQIDDLNRMIPFPQTYRP